MGKYHKKMIAFLIAGACWSVLCVFLLVTHGRMLFVAMTASMAASCFVFAYTSNQDQQYVDRYGDPEEKAKALKAMQEKEGNEEDE